MINQKLAEDRGLDDDTIEKIKMTNYYLRDVLWNPEVFLKSPSDVPAHTTALEYKLQNLWGFPADKNKHKYWYQVKGCTCPKLDNLDTYGVKERWIADACPYHGAEPASSWADARFKVSPLS
jgi:hypothetical protein